MQIKQVGIHKKYDSACSENVIHQFPKDIEIEQQSFNIPVVIIIFTVAIFFGALSGYGFYKYSYKKDNLVNNFKKNEKVEQEKIEQVVGIADKKTFKDSATGILEEGGIDGEGNFHLKRPGGESQNVYLTSSTVDLSQFVGKKIRVWGQTFAAKKAGWLMDVGLVEVIK